MKRPFRPQLAAGLALVPRGSVFPLANERSQQLSQSDELVFRASNKKPDLQGLVRIPPPQPASQSLIITHMESGRARNATKWRRFVHKDLLA